MDISLIQKIKLSIVSATGLPKDALHIYIGLFVFLFFSLIISKSLKSFGPLLAVLIIAISGEVLDMLDDISYLGYWRWVASLHDLLNTLFWPTMLFLLAKVNSLVFKNDLSS